MQSMQAQMAVLSGMRGRWLEPEGEPQEKCSCGMRARYRVRYECYCERCLGDFCETRAEGDALTYCDDCDELIEDGGEYFDFGSKVICKSCMERYAVEDVYA